MKARRITVLIAVIAMVFIMALPVMALDEIARADGQQTVAACEHVWSDWNQTRAATVFKKGSMIRSCFICGTSESKVTRKLKPFAKFAKKKYSLKTGKKLTIKAKYAKGDKIKKWMSSDKRIATVNKKGVVTAKAARKTRITAVMKTGKKTSCLIQVSKPATKKKTSASAGKKTSAAAKAGKIDGGGTVYWTPSGSVYHYSRSCSTLSRSRTVYSGSIDESGKSRGCEVCG